MLIVAHLEQILVLLFRTFWNFFLYSNIFDLWLVASEYVEAADAEGQLYCLFCVASGNHARCMCRCRDSERRVTGKAVGRDNVKWEVTAERQGDMNCAG